MRFLWTEHRDYHLRQMHADGGANVDIARWLAVEPAAVQRRLWKLGLRSNFYYRQLHQPKTCRRGKVQWGEVDWSLGDQEIATNERVTRRTVEDWRRRVGLGFLSISPALKCPCGRVVPMSVRGQRWCSRRCCDVARRTTMQKEMAEVAVAISALERMLAKRGRGLQEKFR